MSTALTTHNEIVTLKLEEVALQGQLRAVRDKLMEREAQFTVLLEGATRTERQHITAKAAAHKAAHTRMKNARKTKAKVKVQAKVKTKAKAITADTFMTKTGPRRFPKGTPMAKVRAFMHKSTEPVTCRKVREALNIASTAAANALLDMHQRGEVAREKVMNGGNTPVFHYTYVQQQ